MFFQHRRNDSCSDFPVQVFSNAAWSLKASHNFLTQLQIAVKKYFPSQNEIDYIIAFCNRGFIMRFLARFSFSFSSLSLVFLLIIQTSIQI